MTARKGAQSPNSRSNKSPSSQSNREETERKSSSTRRSSPQPSSRTQSSSTSSQKRIPREEGCCSGAGNRLGNKSQGDRSQSMNQPTDRRSNENQLEREKPRQADRDYLSESRLGREESSLRGGQNWGRDYDNDEFPSRNMASQETPRKAAQSRESQPSNLSRNPEGLGGNVEDNEMEIRRFGQDYNEEDENLSESSQGNTMNRLNPNRQNNRNINEDEDFQEISEEESVEEDEEEDKDYSQKRRNTNKER